MYSGGGGEVLWDTGFARSQGGYATQAERAIQPQRREPEAPEPNAEQKLEH